MINDTATFKSLARVLVKTYPADELFSILHEAIEEQADKEWFEKKWLVDGKLPLKRYKEKEKKYFNLMSTIRKHQRNMIKKNIPIIEIAQEYGLDVKGNKCVCPFHDDKDPSLVFYPLTNSFHCFGCKKAGDVISFIRRMESLNDNNKTS